jgi:hypothetical protein
MLENATGKLTDSQYADIMDATTKDIKANRIPYGKKTSLKEVIKIASLCVGALKRCS